MEKSGSPWSKGALFICEKCGRRDDGTHDKDYAEKTKKDFKGRLRDAGLGKTIRVATSSCLSLCPKDLQVAAWCPAEGELEMLTYKAKTETEDLLEWLKSR